MATAAGSATKHERYIDHNAEETILYMLKDCDLLEFKKFGVSLEWRQYFEIVATSQYYATKKYFRVEYDNLKPSFRFFASGEKNWYMTVAKMSKVTEEIMLFRTVEHDERDMEADNRKSTMTMHRADDMSRVSFAQVIKDPQDELSIVLLPSNELLIKVPRPQCNEPAKYAYCTSLYKCQTPTVMMSALFLAFWNLYSDQRNGLQFADHEFITFPNSYAYQLLKSVASSRSAYFHLTARQQADRTNPWQPSYNLRSGDNQHQLIINTNLNSSVMLQATNDRDIELFHLSYTNNPDVFELYINRVQPVGQLCYNRCSYYDEITYTNTSGCLVLYSRTEVECTGYICTNFYKNYIKNRIAVTRTNNSCNVVLKKRYGNVYEADQFAAMISIILYNIQFNQSISEILSPNNNSQVPQSQVALPTLSGSLQPAQSVTQGNTPFTGGCPPGISNQANPQTCLPISTSSQAPMRSLPLPRSGTPYVRQIDPPETTPMATPINRPFQMADFNNDILTRLPKPTKSGDYEYF